MGDDQTTRRRMLTLGAAAMGAAALGAAEIVTAPGAAAADGDPVLLAATNQASNPTVIEMVNSGESGLVVRSHSDDGSVVGINESNDGYGMRATGLYLGLDAVGGEIGVYSVSDYGIGVKALTYDGVAVHASTAVDAGLALDVEGAVHLSRSGRAVIPKGRRSMNVTAAVRDTTSVVATLQAHQSGVSIEAAVPHPGQGTFTIWLSKLATAPLPVAWLLID
jgi:hypothetical protein